MRYFVANTSFAIMRADCFALFVVLVIVVWLFLAVPWVCLQFVIVLFPDHTHFFVLLAYCKFGNFREGLFSRNFAYAKFRENKILAKCRNHYVVY